MTNPGLNQRLRQRSRRAGFMIGISMAVTIAVCVAGFSFIYAALDNTVSDFVARDVPAPVIPTQQPTEAGVAQTDDPEGDAPPEEPEEEESAAEPTPEPTAEPEPTEESDEFQPDFQSSPNARLNFRSEPSTSGRNETVILGLAEGTLLQSTGETQPSDNPQVDGEEGWLLFQLEDGTEGWLRAIDVEEYEP
ncbi:MAG: SH3 domain-containing protein [Chloroflexia bacterium]|nr:SH3 domain-containing protein [Chloroflexia bacterium]